MKDTFLKYGFDLTSEELDKFELYYNLLIEYNDKFNITAITDKREVYIKHFIDSLLGLKFYSGKNFLDIGSGGGFPAIPILIMNKDINGVLMEATTKKCEFLKVVIEKLNLKSATVLNARAEEVAEKSEYREKFDIVSARAVARLNTLAEYCMPFVRINGKMIAYKGDATEEVKEALNAINVLGGELISRQEYTLEGAKRTIVEIKKIKSTDKKYPRGRGKERKNPL